MNSCDDKSITYKQICNEINDNQIMWANARQKQRRDNELKDFHDNNPTITTYEELLKVHLDFIRRYEVCELDNARLRQLNHLQNQQIINMLAKAKESNND